MPVSNLWIPVLALALLPTLAPCLMAENEVQTIRLPAKYSEFAWGGNGRYMAFHFESEKKVAVYDITTGKRTFEISEILPGNLIAASAKKLIVVSPSQMMIRRWDLESGRREKLALISGNDAPQMALLGQNSEGPLLLVGQKNSSFYDLETLKPRKFDGPKIPGKGRYGLSIHASPDGKTFGSIPTGYGPVGYAIWHIDCNRISQASFGSTSNAIRWAQPTGNGYLILQPPGQIVNRNGRKIQADWLTGGALIPSPDPAYFLDVRLDLKTPKGKRFAKVNICSTAQGRPIYFETGFEELLPKQLHSWHNIVNALKRGHQWRVNFVPGFDRLVTLPANNEQILIRSFNLVQKLKQRQLDYLFVKSLPPLAVQRQDTLRYRIQAESSGKKIRVSLEDGPEGACLAKKNQLQWQVPEEYPEPWARFLFSVKDSNNQEIFHSFEVAIPRRESPTK